MSSLTARQLGNEIHLAIDIAGDRYHIVSPHYEIAAVALGGDPLDITHAFDDVHAVPGRRFVTGYLAICRRGDVLDVTSHGYPAAVIKATTGALTVTPAIPTARMEHDGSVRLDDAGLAVVGGAGTKLSVHDSTVTATGDTPHLYLVHGPASSKIDERIALLRSLAAAVGVPGSPPIQE